MKIAGRGLADAYILHICSKEWLSGYRIMQNGKEVLGMGWSAGSFYPGLSRLVDNGLLARRQGNGIRLAYEYGTTPAGLAHLKTFSKEFGKEELRSFIQSLLSG